jgi:hypothetical protein
MKKLELVVSLNPGKSNEFKQSLQNLSKKLQDNSSSFIINESDDTLSFSILVRWETNAQMQQALRSEEYKILSGAINSLCNKTIVRLDDKRVGNHISNLNSI